MSSHGRKGPTRRERRRQAERELRPAAPTVPAGFTWADDEEVETDVVDPVVDPDEDPWVQLREIADFRRRVVEFERELIDELREAGVSWSDIGAALYMSAQGARQRRARL